MNHELAKDQKKKDILELIRVSTLQPEQIDVMIPALVQQSLMSSKKNANVEQVIATAKERILSDAFLEKFAGPFDEIFSHDEIKTLINYYKSDAMRKFFKNYSKTSLSIYPAFNEIVEEILGTVPGPKKQSLATENDNVITVTKTNYQKEVKAFEGPAVLEVYSTFCGPCKIVAPIFSELSNKFGNEIKFVKLNIENEYQISQELEIQSVPSLLFFKDGKIINRHVGTINKEELDTKIRKTFAK